MNPLLARILLGFLLLSFTVVPSYALRINNQNQIFAQPEEKIIITYLSVSATHHDQILSIYTPKSQFTIDAKSARGGETVNLGTFNKETEIIFHLMDSRTGFCFYNDTRNNLDLANHIQITDLGNGKWRIGWRLDEGQEDYDDLVIILQKSRVPPPSVEKRSAASSWQLYE